MIKKYAFLHIGKTGGTAFRSVISRHNRLSSLTRVDYLSHKSSMQEIAEQNLTNDLIFFVRDPLSRFVSAFNSRLRKGRYGKREWTPREEEAFAHFHTPNELGETLSSLIPSRRDKAKRAIKSIGHLRKSLNDYLGPLDLLKREQNRIFFIGHQATLSEDFERLKLLLQFDSSLTLPSDDQGAHRTPLDMERHLSKKAAANICRYYALDLPIYNWCLESRERLLRQDGIECIARTHEN